MDQQMMMLSGLVMLERNGETKTIQRDGFDLLACCFGPLRFLFAGLIGESILVWFLTFFFIIPGMIYSGFTFRKTRFQKLIKDGWKLYNPENNKNEVSSNKTAQVAS